MAIGKAVLTFVFLALACAALTLGPGSVPELGTGATDTAMDGTGAR